MRAIFVCVCLVVLSPVVFLAQNDPGVGDRTLAFTHVGVIDATGTPMQPDMTVIISGNRITALGRNGSVAVPQNALVTDATGQFMIPGLWDMHQHTFMRKNKLLPLLSLWGDIINGVTGVRDMGDQGIPDDFGDLPMIQDFEWRQAIQAGAVLGPRLVLAGAILEGPPSPRKGWPEIRTEAEARQEVQFLKKFGVDFVKVHDSLPREAFFAIADESKKQGLVFAGHVTSTVSVAEASDAGQKSEEHLLGILVGCSTQEPAMMKAVTEKGLPANVRTLVDTYSADKCKALYAKFVKNNTYITPSFLREMGGLAPKDLNDPRLAYASPAIRAEFAAGVKNFKPEGVANSKLLHETHYKVVREMQAAGVKLMAGTDGRLFGFDLHDELQELVKAGLTPMQALQTATRTPAEYLGLLGSLGTVEKGKLADLVLLDANPLTSIANATKIRAVVVNGRLLDRKALDRMQAQMKEAANPQAAAARTGQ
jgi:imidazolonepropionase-like amidohydrolase